MNVTSGERFAVQVRRCLLPPLNRALKRSRLWEALEPYHQQQDLERWDGQSIPVPHLLKQRIVQDYARRFSLSCPVETGTYHGYMVNACRRTFKEIYSVELDRALFTRAAKKFARYPHVHVLNGDSG